MPKGKGYPMRAMASPALSKTEINKQRALIGPQPSAPPARSAQLQPISRRPDYEGAAAKLRAAGGGPQGGAMPRITGPVTRSTAPGAPVAPAVVPAAGAFPRFSGYAAAPGARAPSGMQQLVARGMEMLREHAPGIADNVEATLRRAYSRANEARIQPIGPIDVAGMAGRKADLISRLSARRSRRGA